MNTSSTTIVSPRSALIPKLLGLGLFIRFMTDTSVQFFNPFLPIIAAGVGADIITMGQLVSLRSFMGLGTPLFALLAHRWGKRPVMCVALLIGAAGLFLVGSSQQLWMVGVGMAVMGAGLFAFNPLLQAYISDRLPYHIRGRGLGILEYAWALAGIGGLYGVGLLISRGGWRLPFLVLGVGLVIGSAAVALLLPPESSQERALEEAEENNPDIAAGSRSGPGMRSVVSALTTIGLTLFAMNHVLIMFGEWLTQEYRLGPAELGRAALVLGVASLSGSILSSLLTDRLGKLRSMQLGAAGSLLAYALLPLFNLGVIPAVAATAVTQFAFEFTLVSSIPLVSEQLPERRSHMMTMAVAAATLSNAVAALTGPWAYTTYGVWGLGSIAAASIFLSLLLMLFWIRER
ncbi:MAG: MFS transporter [Ardenticatenales bacterium]|nr:MFS transporter [Ardenticatenales bacterium]